MQEYEVVIGGITHTVLLTPEDAKTSGALPVVPRVKQGAAADKAYLPKNKVAGDAASNG